VVDAQAFGEAQEHDLLQPMIEGTEAHFKSIKLSNVFASTKLTADSGFYNKKNVEYVYQQGIDAYLPDIGFRKRDPRFADAERHRARHKKEKQKQRKRHHFTSPDFHYDAATHTCICPAGKKLYSNGRNKNLNGYETLKFRGPQKHCVPCHLRAQCMKDPNTTQTRQVAIFIGRSKLAKDNILDKMKAKIDSPDGRFHYSRRMGIVEPVFGHITSTLKLNRFSLRTRKKVDTQWKLYCMVHNLLKIHRYGDIAV
jgi:hypothetical protein